MKNVLITGACGGMGKATARLFKEQGYRVLALDKKADLSEKGITCIPTDVTSEESVKNAFSEVNGTTDSLDAIIHFAGIYDLFSLVEADTEVFDRILGINLRGAFLVNKTFLPLLKKNSRVLIITSELAPLDPLPFTGIYAVTKAALDKYAYALAMELQLLGIRVSVLRAGAVKTDMLGASTTALDRFCEKTELYTCNAKRFKSIVDRVEARSVKPERIAKKCLGIIKKRRPAFAYSVNRNPLLILLNLMPKRMQLLIIKLILK